MVEACCSGRVPDPRNTLRLRYPNFMETAGNKFTPLDYALAGGHDAVAQLIAGYGGLEYSGMQDLAAVKIQVGREAMPCCARLCQAVPRGRRPISHPALPPRLCRPAVLTIAMPCGFAASLCSEAAACGQS